MQDKYREGNEEAGAVHCVGARERYLKNSECQVPKDFSTRSFSQQRRHEEMWHEEATLHSTGLATMTVGGRMRNPLSRFSSTTCRSLELPCSARMLDTSRYPPSVPMSSPSTARLSLAFWLLGLLNNVLYVLILSAAIDLVPSQSTPKGVVLFVNIAPALAVKLGWPYLVTGQVRYARRVLACSFLGFSGMIIVATSPTLYPRLLGIAIASFASGLGEFTFLQLTTLYGSLQFPGADLGGVAVGWFASGTGAAGLVGAGLWWCLRGLGVSLGLGTCAILPLFMPVTYFFLLPPTSGFTSPLESYSSVPVFDTEEADSPLLVAPTPPLEEIQLTTREKLALARPLLYKFMLPLFFVYLAEYIINTGVAPTLLYPVPDARVHPFLGSIIHSLRDYYPLWQLIYQTFVFFSRSSLSIFRIPPLPSSCLALPTLMQLCLLCIVTLESARGTLESLFGPSYGIVVIAFLISLEGISGGLAYVNIFYRLGQDDLLEKTAPDDRRRRAKELEFRIASVGFADTLGILVASLLSSGVEPWLCGLRVARGATPLCSDL